MSKHKKNFENKEFAEWLQSELDARHWRIADLAVKGQIFAASLSKIMTGERGVGPEIATGIAKAFGYPPDVVFRAAGILPPIPNEYPDEEGGASFAVQSAWITDIMKGLSAEERDLLVDYALFIYRRVERPLPEPEKPKEGHTSGETVQIDRDALLQLTKLTSKLTQLNQSTS